MKIVLDDDEDEQIQEIEMSKHHDELEPIGMITTSKKIS